MLTGNRWSLRFIHLAVCCIGGGSPTQQTTSSSLNVMMWDVERAFIKVKRCRKSDMLIVIMTRGWSELQMLEPLLEEVCRNRWSVQKQNTWTLMTNGRFRVVGFASAPDPRRRPCHSLPSANPQPSHHPPNQSFSPESQTNYRS